MFGQNHDSHGDVHFFFCSLSTLLRARKLIQLLSGSVVAFASSQELSPLTTPRTLLFEERCLGTLDGGNQRHKNR